MHYLASISFNQFEIHPVLDVRDMYTSVFFFLGTWFSLLIKFLGFFYSASVEWLTDSFLDNVKLWMGLSRTALNHNLKDENLAFIC